MRICYIVYREDNAMVFDSQVLEYLKNLNTLDSINSCELVLFMHQSNLKKRAEVQGKIARYVTHYKTFNTFSPPFSLAQLDFDSIRLKKHITKCYKLEDEIGVICRGDFATYIASKAFIEFPNSRILFDNRGLPFEESEFSHPTGLLYCLNRIIKRKSILYSKDHCDGYNFVTNNMRDYLTDKYRYNQRIPFTIIPTMYSPEEINPVRKAEIEKIENYSSTQFVISYVGSSAAWQETDQLIDVISRVAPISSKIRFFILTNGKILGLDKLSPDIQKRITMKSVPHSDMKYYLNMTDIGVVIRDNSIVNKVAAPTKIAEYLTNGLYVLYNGEIGIIRDIESIISNKQFIKIDDDGEWISSISALVNGMNKNSLDSTVIDYFNMKNRQRETIELLDKCLHNEKVRE